MRMVRRFSMIRFYLDPRRQKTNKTTKKCVWCGWSSVRLKIGNFGQALTPCLNNSSQWYLKKVISQVWVISKRVSQWIMSSKISQDKKSLKRVGQRIVAMPISHEISIQTTRVRKIYLLGTLNEVKEMKGLDIVRRDWCDLAKDSGK